MHDWFENRELAFLRNVRLLYQDYLDGSPLHRSDTKASVQLLGNLALGNLRRSHLGHLLEKAGRLTGSTSAGPADCLAALTSGSTTSRGCSSKRLRY